MMATPPGPPFSAALCRGLIEAPWRSAMLEALTSVFSAALCRGLIEADGPVWAPLLVAAVFRGFMPRPH